MSISVWWSRSQNVDGWTSKSWIKKRERQIVSRLASEVARYLNRYVPRGGGREEEERKAPRGCQLPIFYLKPKNWTNTKKLTNN